MSKSVPKSTTDDDLELLSELGVDIVSEPSAQRSAREERIIADFEEVERFEGRLPQHGEEHDIFERLYAVRLLFILDGQKVMVADMGEPFVSDYGRQDRRLRVVYDNATESDLLLRSLQRALNKDKASRRITTPDLGPLFSHIEAEDDLPTGYIYVLRSQSEHPFIVKNRSVIHKVGVTGGDVKSRIANAKKDPTYLLADVEIVATFKLANINGQQLEALLHKVFDSARLELVLPDRFGTTVQPREWFLLPLNVIEAVIEKIKEGTIDQFRYDPKTASLTRS
jgi:hypothetical protein